MRGNIVTENNERAVKNPIPKCQECNKKDKVVLSTYGKPVVWEGFECERCYCVVKTIWEENAP